MMRHHLWVIICVLVVFISSIQIITKFLQHFVVVAICVWKLEINILKHLAIHGMTTASRVP